MNAVVDTNVLVSGMICSVGHPGRVIDAVRAGRIQLVVDDRILAEYGDLVKRDYFRRYFSLEEARNIIEFLRHGSDQIVSTLAVHDLPDPGDAPFLEVALSASVPLVTGNIRHYPKASRRGCEVLSPREFVETYLAQ